MTEPSSNIHALLIGIDYYKPNRLYKSLGGAVRDILFIETFLKERIKIPAQNIYKLLSINPENEELAAIRAAQDPEPTYENIVSTFKEITERAEPGEQVYIHYSGHGGQAKTVYPNLKKGSGDQFDEGIVPMDIGDTVEGRYLRDVEMTTLLKRMRKKGLIVTVILDSCHSGGATRGDIQIRSGSERDELERTDQSLVASREELERNWLEETSNKGMGVAGLPQARDYVLLAACQSNEYAYEYAVNGGVERYGALTHWMVDTLISVANSGQALNYKLLHNRIQAQIQSKFPQQLPIILGDSERLVFGSDTWMTPQTVSVMEVKKSKVKLNAGLAQGVSKGTRFSVYPPNTTDFAGEVKPVAVVEINKRPGPGESWAKVLSSEEGGLAGDITIELSAPAVMVSAPVDLIQRVQLIEDKVAGESDNNELPSELVSRQAEALAKVREALAGNGWVVEPSEGESALFQVAVDRAGNYEICKGSPILNLRPLLSIDDATAPKQVVERLVHLTKYQAVRDLHNAGSKLAESLEVELLDEDGEAFSNPANPEVDDGDIITIRLRNKGAQPLKIALMDIEPTWAVSQIPVDGIASPFFSLDAGAERELQLSMSLPDDAEYERATEFLKVFAVQSGLADFRWLTLPTLDEPPTSRGAEFEKEGAVTRGVEEEVNPLNDLMSMIGADIENAPTATRSGTLVVNPKNEWVTKQVQFVINS